MERSGEENEGVVAQKYQVLQKETSLLVAKIIEIEDEKKEYELVLDTIKELEDTRKCWRMVNGVLFEKNKAETIPELVAEIANMENVIKQITDALSQKKGEIARLEQKYFQFSVNIFYYRYESLMKQAKEKQEDIKQNEVKAGGVLV
ncbi:probable prefoldin subunit 2-like [Stylonychia lemnae]|uniref:Probable prefoldin subunit 2-like n=1 Tax=Stylonychia lemnae TaxID=5949 RepID=A0A078B2P8_STYLE|nr:probable prefoldin subunit 2-like [Stylonychia lemnae]|eukprot:CDW88810.1 probable prefoldin subunit 2-like [Stylonychia lemnae]